MCILKILNSKCIEAAIYHLFINRLLAYAIVVEKTQKVVMDSKKSEMKEKVESGEIPAQQAQKMKEKMGNQSVNVKQAKLKTIVSQGSNLQASNIVTNILSGVGQNLNKQINLK